MWLSAEQWTVFIIIIIIISRNVVKVDGDKRKKEKNKNKIMRFCEEKENSPKENSGRTSNKILNYTCS